MRGWPGSPLNPRLTEWHGRRVWIVGASSGIGAALARALYARGARLALSARREPALQALVHTLPEPTQPTPPPRILPLDVTDSAQIAAHSARLQGEWGGIDLVLWVAGLYEPMRAQTWDRTAAQRMLQTNLLAVFEALGILVPQLLRQGSGGIALVASVAGYRGLPQALVYGPTKAALINLAESLYMDLHPAGLGVYLINPGYVDTPATAGNPYTMPALISADAATAATLAGLAAGQFEIHYPKRFTAWLKLARILPYRWYFTLVRRVTGL